MMRGLLKKGTYVVLGILCCILMWVQFGTDSYAFTRTTGEVTGSSVKVRKEAGTDSDVIASVKAGNKLDVTDAVNGADGKVWYKILINDNEYGYIRSDFVSLEGGEQTPSSSATTTPATTPSDVTPMDKQNGHVNTDNVKVRKQATTGSEQIDKLNPQDSFVVSGSAKGTDGKIWYQVSYLDDGAEKNGFIRSDLVTLTGLVEEPEETPQPPVEEEPDEPVVPDAPTPSVQYEAVYTTDENGEYIWYLYNRTAGQRYKIDQLLQVDGKDKARAEKLEDANFTLKIWLIIVVCLLVMVGVFIAFYFLKLREDEEAMPRRRNTGNARPSNSQRQAAVQNSARTQNSARVQSGARTPNTAKPQQNASQQVRPAQPVQTKSQNPVNAKPTPPQAQKPSAANVQAQKQKTSWKAKNFLDDNDEFEFGFLDFDDDDE